MNIILADTAEGTVTFQPNIWGILVGVVLPIAVGLVTKAVTNPSAKATLLLLLTAINGFVTEFIAAQASGANYDLSTALYTWGGSFAIAVAVHFGFWRPTGATAWAQRNMVK